MNNNSLSQIFNFFESIKTNGTQNQQQTPEMLFQFLQTATEQQQQELNQMLSQFLQTKIYSRYV